MINDEYPLGYKYPELTDENMKIIDISERYRKCFVTEYDSKTNKRWKKYIEKFKKELFCYIEKIFPAYKEGNIYNVSDFIISILHVYYDTFKEEDEDKRNFILTNTFCSLIKNYNKENQDIFLNDYIDNIITYINIFYDKDFNKLDNTLIDLNLIIENEIENCAKDYISKMYATHFNIEESSYFLTLPIDTIDILEIFSNLLNRLIIDIEHIFISNFSDSFLKYLKDETKESFMNENQNLLSSIQEKDNTINEQKNIISNLNNKLTEMDNVCNQKLKENKDYNFVLQRKNVKLEKKYKELYETYFNLKNTQSSPLKNNDLPITELVKEVNLDANYVFVMIDDISLRSKIKEVFKNAVFVSNNINLNEKNIDLVIFMTSILDHTTYYGIKNQCKNNKIPFIHCEYFNINLIKELIWNELN